MTAKIFSAFIALMILFSLCSCGKKEEVKAKPVRAIKWIVLGKDNNNLFINLPGEVRAVDRAFLAFQVPGQIIELPVIIGQQVEKGQLLARLDDKNYMNEFNKTQAVERKAKVDYERYKDLNAKKVISDKEYEQHRRNYAVAITNRKTAQKNENDTFLKAPFAGIIASKNVKNYQNVKAEEKIIMLQNLKKLEIVIHVPVRELTPEHKGDLATYAEINNFKNEKFKLKIREFSTSIDQDTMTYQVTLEMIIPKEFKGRVLPGMLANVYIGNKENGKDEKRIMIPVQAVVADAKGNPFVWVVDPQTYKISKRVVVTGGLAGDDILITKGLKNKEWVAVSGVHDLHLGQKVKKYEREK